MKKFEYNEPIFKVIISSAQDVVTTSEAVPVYNQGQFESEEINFTI